MTNPISNELRASLTRVVADITELLSTLPGLQEGKLPNKRGGFHHIHSNETECGIAYVLTEHEGRAIYRPCSKLVNHAGACGYANNSAL